LVGRRVSSIPGRGSRLLWPMPSVAVPDRPFFSFSAGLDDGGAVSFRSCVRKRGGSGIPVPTRTPFKGNFRNPVRGALPYLARRPRGSAADNEWSSNGIHPPTTASSPSKVTGRHSFDVRHCITAVGQPEIADPSVWTKYNFGRLDVHKWSGIRNHSLPSLSAPCPYFP